MFKGLLYAVFLNCWGLNTERHMYWTVLFLRASNPALAQR